MEKLGYHAFWWECKNDLIPVDSFLKLSINYFVAISLLVYFAKKEICQCNFVADIPQSLLVAEK